MKKIFVVENIVATSPWFTPAPCSITEILLAQLFSSVVKDTALNAAVMTGLEHLFEAKGLCSLQHLCPPFSFPTHVQFSPTVPHREKKFSDTPIVGALGQITNNSSGIVNMFLPQRPSGQTPLVSLRFCLILDQTESGSENARNVCTRTHVSHFIQNRTCG